jgi:hypothetical protein
MCTNQSKAWAHSDQWEPQHKNHIFNRKPTRSGVGRHVTPVDEWELSWTVAAAGGAAVKAERINYMEGRGGGRGDGEGGGEGGGGVGWGGWWAFHEGSSYNHKTFEVHQPITFDFLRFFSKSCLSIKAWGNNCGPWSIRVQAITKNLWGSTKNLWGSTNHILFLMFFQQIMVDRRSLR